VSAFRLRQLARIARAMDEPGRALSRLTEWLERFPDSPESGPLWIDRCVNAVRTGEPHRLPEAATALGHARALLGDSPVLDKVDGLLASAAAVAVVGG
jgi:hypothetical protein